MLWSVAVVVAMGVGISAAETGARGGDVVAEGVPVEKDEVARRQTRSPHDVAAGLTKTYGRHLKSVMYQPSLAVIARMQLAKLDGNRSEYDETVALLSPYLEGDRKSQGDKPNGSEIAGHMLFAQPLTFDENDVDPRGVKLVTAAADWAFQPDGSPREAMPSHNEMSDAVFMGGPILCAAARMTGETKYLEMAERHLRFMQAKCLREDGLYRHSPLCESPWGRGNGFPAIGLTLCLTELEALLASQPDSPSGKIDAAEAKSRKEFLLKATWLHASLKLQLEEHLRALLKHQDESGMWRQVIDHPESYREMTATCMIGFAMTRGVARGWLDRETYQPAIDRAWRAVNTRIADDGVLFGVCTGTGKQKSLEDYLNRPMLFEKDERGGAMALLFSVELCVPQRMVP